MSPVGTNKTGLAVLADFVRAIEIIGYYGLACGEGLRKKGAGNGFPGKNRLNDAIHDAR